MRQGYSKEINLNGIARALTRDGGVDGVCDDMLNLRYENGAWKALRVPTQVYEMDVEYDNVWIHTGNDYRHVFGVADGELKWFANINADGTWQDVNPVKTLCGIGKNELCTENGNLVCVGGNTFLLYDIAKNTYNIYNKDVNGAKNDEVLNPDGQVDFRVVQKKTEDDRIMVVHHNADLGLTSLNTGLGWYDFSEDELTEMKACIVSLERGHREYNSFYAPFLVCSALKTYSGEYVLASRPLLMYPQSAFYNANYANQQTACMDMPPGPGDGCYIGVVKNLDTNGSSINYVAVNNNKIKMNQVMFASGPGGGNYGALVDVDEWMFPCASGMLTAQNGKYKAFFNGSVTKLQMKADALNGINKELYTKLCVFVTPCEADFAMDTASYAYIGTRDNKAQFILKLKKRDKSKVIKGLKRNNFYKIAEIETNAITGDWMDVELEDGVLLNIAQQEILGADTTTRNSTSARGSYNYNGRLHLFDYDTQLFHGWPLNYFYENPVDGCLPVATSYDNIGSGMTNRNMWLNLWEGTPSEIGKCSWYIEVEVEKEDGKSKVVRYCNTKTEVTAENELGINSYFGRKLRSLNGCLSYPDARAKKMTIFVKRSKRTMNPSAISSDYIYAKLYEFDLTPMARLNTAVYIDPDLKPINIFDNDTIQPPLRTAPSESNTTTRYKNGLKVSATDNPLYFPAEHTYLIGNRGIIGMMANEVAVGSGQTGDAPLMVFCEDGVYGLFVDETGKLAYNYSRPIASDICNGIGSIRRVDGGIVFATDRGLMMLKGSEVGDIGEIAEGEPIRFYDVGSTEFVPTLKGAFEHASIGSFNIPCSSDFREFLHGCVVGYNHLDKCVLVGNENYGYHYRKDFDGLWTRVDGCLRGIVDNYPESFAVSGERIIAMDRTANEKNAADRVFLLTRPIASKSVSRDAGDSFKENYRVVVRGEFHTGTDILGLYVCGSYDGRRWSVLGGRERTGDFVDIGCLVERVDVRYLLVCLSGTIGKKGYIDNLIVESKYK